MLKAKFRALLPEDPLESLITGGTDLLTLRSTLDLQAETNRNEFDAIHRRIDRLESIVTPPEATGSVRAPHCTSAASRPRNARRRRINAVTHSLSLPGLAGQSSNPCAVDVAETLPNRSPVVTGSPGQAGR